MLGGINGRFFIDVRMIELKPMKPSSPYTWKYATHRKWFVKADDALAINVYNTFEVSS